MSRTGGASARVAATAATDHVPGAAVGGERPSSNRRVLMILYFYPPVGGTSMSRNIRNVQYLPRYGWEPVVLTPRGAAFHLQDHEALKLIPAGTEILRTPIVEAAHIRPAVVGMLGSLNRLRRSGDLENGRERRATNGDDALTGTRGPAPGTLERLRHRIFFPDDQIGWLPFALAEALRAHRERPFDAVYSTASPITSHLIAGLFKQATGVPWIAEFRDPWRGNALAPRLPWFHRRLQAKIERWIVRTADRVVGLSDGITGIYRTRYPSAPEMVTITSGYDRAEAAPARSPDRGGSSFRLVYTGTLDRPLELEIFLEGLSRSVDRDPSIRDRLSLSFYGFVEERCRELVDRYAAGNLAGMVTLKGFVPRREALSALASADAALILLGPGPGMEVFIGGKLFDYIGQDMQILAMLPPGDARKILEDLGWGVICDPNPTSVAEGLARLLETPRPVGRADPQGTYERATLAGRLADSLDAIVAPHDGAPTPLASAK